MVISRRSLLLAGAAIPTAAYGQCVTDRFTVDACMGGVRIARPAGVTLSLDFMSPGTLDPRITFTRASSATYTDASGVVQTAATNLMLWSQDITQTVWQKQGAVVVSNTVTAPNGTNTGQTISIAANGGGPAFYQIVPGTTGTRYEPSFWINPISTTGTLKVSNAVNGANGDWSVNMALLSAGWQRITRNHPAVTILVEFTGVTNQIGMFIYTTGATINASWWGFQLEQGSAPTFYVPTTSAANGAPRWDYANGVLRGLLIEEQRANLAFPSVPDAGVRWTLNGPAAQGGSVVAPNGATSTTSLIAATDTTNSVRSIALVVTGLAGTTTYTLSVFLKAAPNNCAIQMNINGSATVVPMVYFDLTNGTAVVGADLVPGATGLSASITPYPNGWYRGRFTFTTNAGAANMNIYVGPCVTVSATGDNRSYVGVVGQGVYVWGAQVEQGAFPTSWIPTVGASATRAADICQIIVGVWFDQAKGSLAHEYILEGAPVAFASSAQLVGGNLSTEYIIPEQYDNTGTPTTPSVNAAAVSTGGTVAFCLLPATSAAAGPVHKSAVGWSMGVPINAAHDGIGKSSDSGAVTALPVITKLTIGGTMHDQPIVSQWARRTQYWPRQLSQAETITVTT
jgi:hypothetical protein